MNLKHLIVAVPATLFVLGNGTANAGQTINEEGAPSARPTSGTSMSRRRDTSWSTTLADALPQRRSRRTEAAPHDCVGKYEYMPDGSWKGSGTCT